MSGLVYKDYSKKLINNAAMPSSMIPFTKKYCPVVLADVKGQDAAVKTIHAFAANFKKQKKKALLLYGPSGTGKTCAAHAMAHSYGLEIIEVNASDFRTKEQILQRVGSALQQQSLFSKGKVILIDEIDGLAGNKDRGGLPTIVQLIDSTVFPILLTVQNPWDFKLNNLKRRCEMVEFLPLDTESLASLLASICKKENITYEADVLKGLVRRSGGDARAATTDLQTLTELSNEITQKSLEELQERAKEESMPSALLKIFKTTDPLIAIHAFDNVKEDIDEQLLWIDQNLPEEYEKNSDLAKAYDALSRADVFKRRIRRWQYWRFLVYVNALMTAGIAVSKDEKYKKFVQYKPTGRLLKIWWANQKNLKKKAIAAKIAEKIHCSAKEVIRDIEYFKVIFKKNKQMAQSITEYLELDAEEVAWLRK